MKANPHPQRAARAARARASSSSASRAAKSSGCWSCSPTSTRSASSTRRTSRRARSMPGRSSAACASPSTTLRAVGVAGTVPRPRDLRARRYRRRPRPPHPRAHRRQPLEVRRADRRPAGAGEAGAAAGVRIGGLQAHVGSGIIRRHQLAGHGAAARPGGRAIGDVRSSTSAAASVCPSVPTSAVRPRASSIRSSRRCAPSSRTSRCGSSRGASWWPRPACCSRASRSSSPRRACISSECDRHELAHPSGALWVVS